MVISVVHDLGGLFLGAVVSHKESAGRAIGYADADLAVFTVADLVSVGIEKGDVIDGTGFTHRTDLMTLTDKICYHTGTFGLSEAVHYLESRVLFKLLEDLGVQRLARGGGVLQGGIIVLRVPIWDIRGRQQTVVWELL